MKKFTSLVFVTVLCVSVFSVQAKEKVRKVQQQQDTIQPQDTANGNGQAQDTAAQDQTQPDTAQQGEDNSGRQPGMAGHGGRGMRGCPMMAAKGMGAVMPTVIPTQDGGIIVINGTSITKYDRNLKRGNSITVNPDFEGIRNLMQQAHQAFPQCPMMDTTGAQTEQ